MSLEYRDSVKDETTTTGTGTVTAAGSAPAGYRTLSAGVTDGATVRYRIYDSTQTEWEIGEGVWSNGAGTLSRLVVFASSNAGALVNFSAGTKAIIVTPTAADFTQTIFLASDQTNNNATPNTLQDLTGLAFPVVSGRRYKVRVFMWFTAAAVTTGGRIVLDGPAMTSLVGRMTWQVTTLATQAAIVNGLNTPAGSLTASATTNGNMAYLEAIAIPSANGTVQARFASEVASSAIVAKADVTYIEWQEYP